MIAPIQMSTSGNTVTVSTANQLLTAVKAGDTILLAPVSFGDVLLSNVRPFGAITIKSTDSNNNAVFRTLNIIHSNNLIIEDIDISRPLAPGASQNSYAVKVGRASDITFIGIDVSGSMNNDARDDGFGMSLNGSRISVLDSTFTQLRTAVAAAGQDFLFAGTKPPLTQVRSGSGANGFVGGIYIQSEAFLSGR